MIQFNDKKQSEKKCIEMKNQISAEQIADLTDCNIEVYINKRYIGDFTPTELKNSILKDNVVENINSFDSGKVVVNLK